MCTKYVDQYVSYTVRSLATRTAEHADVSVRTGLPLSQPHQSHIREHLFDCGGPQICLDHFDVIGTCNSSNELRLLQSLHIHKIKPKLNCMHATCLSSCNNQLTNVFFFIYMLLF